MLGRIAQVAKRNTLRKGKLNFIQYALQQQAEASDTAEVQHNPLGADPLLSQGKYSEYCKLYAKHVWTHVAVQLLASVGASVPFRIFRAPTKKALSKFHLTQSVNPQEVQKLVERFFKSADDAYSELLELFRAVNPTMTLYDLWESTIGFLELTGNAYWLKLRADNSKIVGLDVLNPIGVSPPKQKGDAFLYHTSPRENPQRYDPKDIVHFRKFNPISSRLGSGNVSPVYTSIKSDLSRASFEESFFSNSAIPSLILHAEEGIPDEEVKRIQEEFVAGLRGPANWFKVGVLTGGVTIDTKLTPNLNEMQLTELQQNIKYQVLAAFGVPPALAGDFTQMTEANARVQLWTFGQMTLKPLLRKIAAAVTEYLLRDFDPLLVGVFDDTYIDAMVQDPLMAVEAGVKGVSAGLFPVNEWRQERGKPKVPWGDTWHPPVNLRVGTEGNAANPYEDEKAKTRSYGFPGLVADDEAGDEK